MSNERSSYTIQPVIEVNITSEDIDDIMCAALEGGINYWCCKAEVVGKYFGEYASEQISHGGALILYDAESNDKWELTLNKFLNGMKLAIKQSYGLYVNPVDRSIDTGQIDADMADAIVQLALFGEVVFG